MWDGKKFAESWVEMQIAPMRQVKFKMDLVKMVENVYFMTTATDADILRCQLS